MGRKRNNWHSLSIRQTLEKIHSSENGLTELEVEKRLKKFGFNKLPEGKELIIFEIFLAQFQNPMILILVVAMIISAIVGEYVDMVVILLAILLNTVLGFIQEYKANKAIKQLKNLLKYDAKVIRNSNQEIVPTETLVPGDIIILESGDRVPADARIIWQKNLEVNEASLTGESMPVKKDTKKLPIGTPLADRKNMVYMGTNILAGRCKAVVCETGTNTYFGEIAHLITEDEEDKTPLQKQLLHFSYLLGVWLLLISLFIFLLGIYENRDVTNMLLVSIAVAVAAVPEGLVISLTVILAVGMQKIVKKNALVRKLVATETLGSVSVICSDKTGTLTEGEMQVVNILTGESHFKNKMIHKKDNHNRYKTLLMALKIGVLCNDGITEFDDLNALQIIGNPTDRAFLLAGISSGINISELKNEYYVLDEIPFTSKAKYMAKLLSFKDGRDGNFFCVKGAPEKVLQWVGYQELSGTTKILNKAGKQKLVAEYLALTKKGLRVLALAYKITKSKSITKKDFENMVFVAFVGLADPLREDAKKAIQLCINAGIHTVIITGDHKLTARTIVSELGLELKDDNILEGDKLAKVSDKKLQKIINRIFLYTRVEPSQKVRIVKAWKEKGHIVAMIGDGINDAPALKAADIGVALGAGTDVSKQIADMILLDNRYMTIVSAVEKGRMILDNIRKVILYLLTAGFSEMILVTTSIILGYPLAITTAQILWINLIVDGLPSISLSLEPAEKDLLKRPPRKKNEPIMNREMKFIIFFVGIFADFLLAVFFIYLFKSGMSIDYIRTMMFTILAMNSLLYIFSIRSLRNSILKINPFSNRYLIMAVFITIIIQVSVLYIPSIAHFLGLLPLRTFDWFIILWIAIFKVILIEIAKFLSKNVKYLSYE